MNFTKLVTSVIIFLGCFSNLHSANEKNNIAEIAAKDPFSKFATYIEESIENGNPSFLSNSFDLDQFINGIFDKYNPTGKSDFDEGFKNGFLTNFNLGIMIIDEISENGSYKFLKSYAREGKNYLLFRLLSDNGINYHELEVISVDGDIKITDVLLYHTGEKISETIGNIYKAFIITVAGGDTASNENSNEYIELQNIKAMWEQGKSKKAFKKWQSMPAQARNKKSSLILGLQISSGLGNKQYLEVFDEYCKKFPETNSKYLIPVESLVSTKNYSQALYCIDNLDKGLDSDPMLNYLRANVLFEMGNIPEAACKLNQVIETVPDFERSYFSLLNIYIKDKNYSEATHLLDKIIVNLNYYKGSMPILLNEFPEFCKSKEYQSWFNQ